jgi:branched-chain amino acid transport system permease protein
MVDTEIDASVLVNFGFSIVIMAVLSFVVKNTRFGLRLRAVAENRELALCSGIQTSKDEWTTVAMSSGLAGIAAVLVCQAIGTTSPFIGIPYGLKGLVVILVGGLGKMRAAVVVGLFLGLTEALSVGYLSSSYRDAVAFALLISLVVGKQAISSIPRSA